MVKKKTVIRYKLKIYSLLKKFPITTYEASKYTGCHLHTAKKILEMFERLNKAEQIEIQKKMYWRIKK